MPDIGPSFCEAKIVFNSSAIALGWDVRTGTMPKDIPFITSTSKIEMASSIFLTSWSLPESVIVFRTSSVRTTPPRGEIGSMMRLISFALTYLSWTTCTAEPKLSGASLSFNMNLRASRGLIDRDDFVGAACVNHGRVARAQRGLE